MGKLEPRIHGGSPSRCRHIRAIFEESAIDNNLAEIASLFSVYVYNTT